MWSTRDQDVTAQRRDAGRTTRRLAWDARVLRRVTLVLMATLASSYTSETRRGSAKSRLESDTRHLPKQESTL